MSHNHTQSSKLNAQSSLSDGRYVVGIDLGTTNSALGNVDLFDVAPGEMNIKTFEILQLVAEGRTGLRTTLPSFLYLPGPEEVRSGLLALPWARNPSWIAGEYARAQGESRPERLVSSAKSWLCHGGVDRRSKILPWGAQSGVPKVSPIEASARYLEHLRLAWAHSMDTPLERQDVILTVPASFDQVARELTLEAAKMAGIPNVTLIEEPLAAFYSWLSHNEGNVQELLNHGDLVLVCDVGGGTTDFTLVECIHEGAGVRLERVAVGDHLLLGGDNMDLALAAFVEGRIERDLRSWEWQGLVNQVRSLKERLFAPDGPDSDYVRITGRGRGLVSGTTTVEITKDECLSRILEGFFPLIDPEDAIEGAEDASGLREMGLPYQSDTAITRHLLRFLMTQGQGRFPDCVLFNGGALKPAPVRERIIENLRQWSKKEVRGLQSSSLDLAISIGAAYYGLSKRGLGLKVGGGIPRSYYIGVDVAGEARDKGRKAVCLIERGTEEGEEVEVARPFRAVTNRPVSFRLYSSTRRRDERCGDIVDTDGLFELPHLVTVLRYGKKGEHRKIPVRLKACVNPIGTIDIFCQSEQGPHRWRLQFDLRQGKNAGGISNEIAERVEGVRVKGEARKTEDALSNQEREILVQVKAVIEDYFNGALRTSSLSRALQEETGMEKGLWRLPFLRAMADIFLEEVSKRGRSPSIEATWFNLTGYVLRPGVGEGLDPWRMKKVWPLWFKGLFSPGAKDVRIQWWIFWRRVSAGLSPGQQDQIFSQVARAVMPKKKGRKKGGAQGPRLSPGERREVLSLMGALEKVSPEKKKGLGDLVIQQLKGEKGMIRSEEPRIKHLLWLIGKIGARHLLYGPQDRTVSPMIVSSWLKEMRRLEFQPGSPLFRAAVAMARCTGDRVRDLTSSEREAIATWLEALGAPADLVRPVLEPLKVEEEERSYSFGEALPAGLIIEEDGV